MRSHKSRISKSRLRKYGLNLYAFQRAITVKSILRHLDIYNVLKRRPKVKVQKWQSKPNSITLLPLFPVKRDHPPALPTPSIPSPSSPSLQWYSREEVWDNKMSTVAITTLLERRKRRGNGEESLTDSIQRKRWRENTTWYFALSTLPSLLLSREQTRWCVCTGNSRLSLSLSFTIRAWPQGQKGCNFPKVQLSKLFTQLCRTTHEYCYASALGMTFSIQESLPDNVPNKKKFELPEAVAVVAAAAACSPWGSGSSSSAGRFRWAANTEYRPLRRIPYDQSDRTCGRPVSAGLEYCRCIIACRWAESCCCCSSAAKILLPSWFIYFT